MTLRLLISNLNEQTIYFQGRHQCRAIEAPLEKQVTLPQPIQSFLDLQKREHHQPQQPLQLQIHEGRTADQQDGVVNQQAQLKHLQVGQAQLLAVVDEEDHQAQE